MLSIRQLVLIFIAFLISSETSGIDKKSDRYSLFRVISKKSKSEKKKNASLPFTLGNSDGTLITLNGSAGFPLIFEGRYVITGPVRIEGWVRFHTCPKRLEFRDF
jgi:hypothetical protein